jgi:hypothetical protein
MRLRGLARVMRRMKGVSMRRVCMMSGLVMMTGSIMSRGFLVVLHGMLVMLGGLRVMSMCRMLVVRGFLSHTFSPFE